MTTGSFRESFVQACSEGVLLGAKIIVALGLILLAAGWVFNDYAGVRQRADHGEAAYQVILKAQQQAQQAQKP